MIGNDSRFVSAFGRAVLDKTELGAVVAKAVKAGFAIVLCEPGTKRPVCTLTTPTTRARADKRAREDAKAAGVERWDRVRHPCGLKHALEDPDKAKAVYAKVQAQYEEPLNLAIVAGRSRMVCVDVDTPEQLVTFMTEWGHGDRTLTVESPGTADGAHHGGGHIWFEIPAPLDLSKGTGKYVDESGWTAMWGESYALVPPSRRPEGPYVFQTPDIDVCPSFLLDLILAEPEPKPEESGRPKGPGDPADIWAMETPWAGLLAEPPHMWTETGKSDQCGCPIWTAPGGRSDPKSATAHEAGCPRTDTSTGHGPLHIWTDTPPEFLKGRRNVTKLQYLACRDYGGNVAAAMRAQGIASTLAPVPSDPWDEPDSVNGPEEDLKPCKQCGDEAIGTVDGHPFCNVCGTREREILTELGRIKVREEAKRRLSVETAGDRPEPYSTPLGVLLAEPDDEPQYRIEGLWPTGGTVVFSAQQKAGKTTMVGNIVRCLVDGDPFLGLMNDMSIAGALAFPVTPLAQGETVMVADLELDRRTLRRWLRDQGIRSKGKVRAESFRGRLDDFDILDPARREAWATALKLWGVRVLVIDPLGPLLAAYGFSEDSNTDVSVVLNAIGSLAAQAGVEEVMVVHHMGHNGERSRGASRLRGWPDVEWRLVREESAEGQEPGPDAARFFTAEGRDVAVPESQLEFDPVTRHLSIAGGNRSEHKETKWEPKIAQAVESNPGATQNRIMEVVDSTGQPARRALKSMVERGLIHVWTAPGRKGTFHVIGCDCSTPTACDVARIAGGV